VFNRFKKIMNRPSIAIDLGTANTRIFSADIGQVRERPSTVRPPEVPDNNTFTGDYISYLNSKISYNPLRGGVIVDIYNAINLLKPLLKETRRGIRSPISLASAPTDTTPKERELLAKAIIGAGASHVAIIPEVWAAAIGAGIDVSSERAQVLIDIGEGVTDLAVIRDGQLIYTAAIRTACSDLQKAVRSAIVSRHKVYVCRSEAERLTNTISSIVTGESINSRYITIQGNDIFKGNDVTIDISEKGIIIAMEPVINRILKMVEFNVKRLSGSIYNEIIDTGVCLSGGGALISGIDKLIESRINLGVRIAPDPIRSVINGEIETLNYWQGHKNWWENIFWPEL
jgi:rod shape-determining protein MreB and related proteins